MKDVSKVEYYCKDCNEEFDNTIVLSAGDNNERCPCCYSTSVKAYNTSEL